MAAPTLAEAWKEKLWSLTDNWDGCGAKPITTPAIECLESFSIVPASSGGLQLEVHRNGFSIEIEISPEGRIIGALVAVEGGRNVSG